MLKAIHDVYSVDKFQRAKEIREMVKRDNIYVKRSVNMKLNAGMPILTKIAKKWAMSGQKKKNRTRELMCKAFEKEYSNVEIGLQVRRYTFRSLLFLEDKRNTDKKYRAILSILHKCRKD